MKDPKPMRGKPSEPSVSIRTAESAARRNGPSQQPPEQDAPARVLVAEAVALRKPERLPVLLFGTNPYSASFSGVRFSDCMLDNDVYVDCVAGLARHFRPDGLFCLSAAISAKARRGKKLVERDGVRFLVDEETGEDFTCVPDDGNPLRVVNGAIVQMQGTQRLEDAEELLRAWPDAPPLELAESMYCHTGTDDDCRHNVSRVNAALQGRVLLGVGVANPCNSLVTTYGFEPLCDAMRERPALVKRLVALHTRWMLRPLRARIEAGATLVYTGSSWASLMSRDLFAEFFYEPQVMIHQAVRESGAFSILHATGTQMHFMDLNVKSKPDIVLVDHVNGIREVKKRFGGQVCLAGGFDPSRTLYTGTPGEVRREIESLLDVMAGAGGYILCTSDCVVLNTPRENLEALFAAARER